MLSIINFGEYVVDGYIVGFGKEGGHIYDMNNFAEDI